MSSAGPMSVTGHAAENAMDDPDEIERFYDRCSDLMRALMAALAAAPDHPRPFPEIEGALAWPRRRIASVLGGVSHLRHTEFAGHRPYRFLDDRRSQSGRWELWMDSAQAQAVRTARRGTGAALCQADRMEPTSSISSLGGQFVVRRAVADDVAAIVALIAADQIGRDRDGGDLEPYMEAFTTIDADPAQLLVVVTDAPGAVVGTLQLTFIPGLARRGALRAQIEAVRVGQQLRGQGLGGALLAWAIQEAQRRGCALVQLSSDKRRQDAHRLYGRLGFIASHEGFKLRLAEPATAPS